MSFDAQAVRELLTSRRAQLLRRYLGHLDRASEELESRESEAVEDAAEQWDARLLSTLGDRDLRAVGELDAALSRLDQGRYGACTVCDQPIDDARLAALPEASVCFDCACRGARPRARVG